jgi:mercuric ion transport protein
MKLRIADAAGAGGAIFAALCCAGTPIIISALAATGLAFVRALWGFWQGRTRHRNSGPMALGTAAALSIASGVILVHGPPAMEMIYGGAGALVIATLWNARERR